MGLFFGGGASSVSLLYSGCSLSGSLVARADLRMPYSSGSFFQSGTLAEAPPGRRDDRTSSRPPPAGEDDELELSEPLPDSAALAEPEPLPLPSSESSEKVAP